MHLLETLEDIGLRDKKARVYLACLELGVASASEIAKMARISRTTIYEILNDLVLSGLISSSPKERGTLYSAESPEHLKELIKQKEKDINRILPELRSLFNLHETKPRVLFYEGVQGVRALFTETLLANDTTLRALLSVSDFNAFLGKEWFQEYTKKRVASGKKLLVVRPEDKEVGGLYPTSKQENREVRYTPRGMEFGFSQYLYDSKVLLISTKKEGYGMIIESGEYHAMQLQLFNVLWSVSRVTKAAD